MDTGGPGAHAGRSRIHSEAEKRENEVRAAAVIPEGASVEDLLGAAEKQKELTRAKVEGQKLYIVGKVGCLY